jgi:soluble lytic murein transglycosylase
VPCRYNLRMNAPPRWIAAAAVPLLALSFAGAAKAVADPYADARREFVAAYAEAGRKPPGTTEDSRALRDYPLYPYLQAARLQSRLGDPAAAGEITAFLKQHGDAPVARSLRRSWLMSLAERKSWAAYLDAYREDVDDSSAARCNALAARVALGRTDGLEEAITTTYLSPKSLPDACDPAFDWLRQRDRLDNALVLRRARMALAEGEAGLARYLARSLPDAQAGPINQWAALIEQPRGSIEALTAAPERDVEAAALLDGWTRYARSDPEGAADRYRAFTQARALDARAASPYALAVALPLSWRRTSRSLEFFALADPIDFDERAHEWHVRAALWAGDWARVARGIAAMPEPLRTQNRWRYWAARAAGQLDDRDAAQAGYAAVVPTDNWYAALSAARLGQRFTPTVVAVPRDDAVMESLRTQPPFVRTRELILCDLDAQANREWLAALEPLARAERAQAVRLASGWGWHLQAIAAAAREGIFDDYDLLYPRPYDPEVRRAAQTTGLPEPLIYAVIRQESLYRADAASSAGALGLMQLLPSTARLTARKNGLQNPSRAELLTPSVNVPLGSAFLKSLMDRAAGQLPLAIAGYNAGPAAARRWLAETPVETDVWVENIPYNETRSYVQRVVWHSVVFAWLEDRKPRDVSGWLGTIRSPAVDAALQPAG